MQYEINGHNIEIPIMDYFKAKRIDRDIAKAIELIKLYKLENVLQPKLEYRSHITLFITMKYKNKHSPYKSGVYIFNGNFNEADFIAKVIKPNWD